MNYYIITGISKGLGTSIASKLLEENNTIIGLSRTGNKKLVEEAYIKDIRYIHHDFDLNEVDKIQDLMKEIFTQIKTKELDSITLVNNAATIGPIQPSNKNTSSQIALHMNINLVAPMVVTSAFMELSQGLACKKRIINISSGASTKPIYGWNCYCASKAGLDMFGRVVALENEEQDVKVLNFSPGIMDTNMQGTIRSSELDNFKDVEKFKMYKDGGHLQDTKEVAKKLLRLVEADEYESGSSVSVYEL